MVGHVGRRWAKAGVALVAGAVTALGASAPAAAEEPVTGVPHSVHGSGIRLLLNGKPSQQAMIKLAVRGTTQTAYCIDFHTNIALNEKYAEGTWNESQVQNLGRVLWVLTHGYPNAKPAQLLEAAGAKLPSGVSEKRRDLLLYFGTQTAIWHFSDGVKLGEYAKGRHLLQPGQYAVVKKVHDYLVANATDEPEPKPTLTIDPEKKSGTAGKRVGPFTVTGPAGAITLTAEGGKVVDADGNTLTETKNGKQFWLTRDSAGTVKVTAKGSGSVSFGRVFLYQGHHPAQKLILGGSVGESVTATTTATFTVETTPVSDTLPVTGTSGTVLLVGALLLATGVVVTLLVRRRRTRFVA